MIFKLFSKNYSYVFTTGGIGPTHDDITSESLAEAFNKKYEINKEAFNILEKYYLELEDSEISRKIPPNTKEILPQISGIMLLRQAIIEINKSQRNPIASMSSEDIKAEYGYLRVKLLENIKIRIVNKEYSNDILTNDPLEASQKKVDQYEDKFHEISNWLGYQYLTYKNTTFYKWLLNREHEDLIHSNILNLKDTIGDPREIN